MMGKELRATDVVKKYGDKEVLHGVSLCIKPNTIYGLLGRNGAGKTTLLSVLTAQCAHNAGEVTYGGEKVWENQAALDDICFSRELSPMLLFGQNTMRVKDYLRAASMYYPNWDKTYADRLVSLFELDRKQKIYRLSKGMMSMVTITLALASRAPVTILDEPVAGLDVVAREQFYRLLLADYEQTGRSFVLSTHIIEEASGVFENVILLHEGNVMEDGPCDEFLAQFHMVTGSAGDVEKACAGLAVLHEESLGRTRSVCARGNGALLQSNAAGLSVEIEPVSLQRAFVALTGTEKEAGKE